LKYLLELTSSQNTALIDILKEKKTIFQLIEEIEEADPERIHPSTKQGLLSRLRSLAATGLYRSASPTPLREFLVPSEAVIVCLDQVDDDWIRSIVVKDICYELFKEKTTRGTELESDIIIVVEEAHRYSGKDGSKSILEAISREGRKYGIFEILISQRPSDVDSEIIANLNTLIALRIKNDADLAKIKKMESVDSTIIQKLPRLERGEAIIVGESSITSHPILVKIRPRQTKHVDPRVDQMPPDIQVATELLELPLNEIDSEVFLDEDNSELLLNTQDVTSQPILISSTVEPPSTQTLADALKILHVIVMTKSTGLAVYDEGTGSIQVEVQLIAGCISALKSLLGEIGKAPKIKGRTRFRVLQEEGFLIWSCEGELSIAALLLKRPGSKELERRLRNFVYAFEKHFETDIKNFYGSTDPFIETRTLVDLYLGTSFMYPLRIHPETANLSENERVVQNIIFEVQQGMSPQEGQYVEEIIRRTTTNLDSSLNYRTILNAIIGLAQKNLLFSPTKPKLWIWEFPAIEKTEEERIIETKGKTEKEALSEMEQELLDEFLADIKVSEEIRIGESTTSEPSIGKQIATATKVETKEPSKISPATSIEIPKILEIISDQSPQNIPEDIIEDILVRDIKYDPEYRTFSRTIKVERIPLSDVENFLLRLSQTGHEQLELRLNPLKGPVVILQSQSGKKSVVSISRVNGFCLVIVAT
ncbi:MAG: ATP-binding protein, partial [Promethearchaeota archaeon]